MTGPVNTWMDLRCMEPAYKEDLLGVLRSAIEFGAAELEQAHNEIDAYREAQERGLSRLHGTEVAVQVAVFQDSLNRLPEILLRLERMYKLIDTTPTCEEAMHHRVAARIKATIPKKGQSDAKQSYQSSTTPAPDSNDFLEGPYSETDVVDEPDFSPWW